MDGNLDGIYLANFGSSEGRSAAGLIRIAGSEIAGGDRDFRFSGSIIADGEMAFAKIAVTAKHKDAESVFSELTEFELDLAGAMTPRFGDLAGQVVGRPSLELSVTLMSHRGLAI